MFFRKKSDFSEHDLLSVIQGCINQDARAQRTLFQQYFSFAKSISLRYSSSAEEAEEILNESFLKVFQHIERYDSTQPFKAWLRTIVVNTAISYYRKNQKFHGEIGLDGIAEPAHYDNAMEQIAAEEILALVQQLKPIYRTVFMMHVVDGYHLREIADALDFNEATVRSHFLRARTKLQEMMRHTHPFFFNKQHGTNYKERL